MKVIHFYVRSLLAKMVYAEKKHKYMYEDGTLKHKGKIVKGETSQRLNMIPIWVDMQEFKIHTRYSRIILTSML